MLSTNGYPRHGNTDEPSVENTKVFRRAREKSTNLVIVREYMVLGRSLSAWIGGGRDSSEKRH